ncbi:hypothetical protein GEMRC1_009737 [Eukaryota sp. GEM-RC1]
MCILPTKEVSSAYEFIIIPGNSLWKTRNTFCKGKQKEKGQEDHLASHHETNSLKFLKSQISRTSIKCFKIWNKFRKVYHQKTDPLSCYNFALEWRRYSRARGRGIDAAKHLLDLENQVQAWRSIADPKTMDELLSPFEDQLSINKPTHCEPLHGLDLARDLLLNVDVRGLRLHVDPMIFTFWKNDGTIPTFLNNWYIWERIIIDTQAENPRQEEAVIADYTMDWSMNRRFRSDRGTVGGLSTSFHQSC